MSLAETFAGKNRNVWYGITITTIINRYLKQYVALLMLKLETSVIRSVEDCLQGKTNKEW